MKVEVVVEDVQSREVALVQDTVQKIARSVRQRVKLELGLGNWRKDDGQNIPDLPWWKRAWWRLIGITKLRDRVQFLEAEIARYQQRINDKEIIDGPK